MLDLLAVLTALGLLSRRGGSKAEPKPSFPADNTAVLHPEPSQVVVSPGTPPPAPGPTQTASTSAPSAARPGRGVAPGTPEPGWKPYVPVPSGVVARARQVLSSGALRVTEGDPSGQVARVLYRRERNPVTGAVSVTAWKPAVVSTSRAA